MAKRLFQPGRVDVAAPVGADRPLGDELREGTDRLRHRYGVVHRVGEIEVDRVDPRRWRLVASCRGCEQGKTRVGPFAHRVERLRRQHDPVAHVGTLRTQPAAEIRLAAAAAVGVGGVVRRDPGFPRGVEQRVRLVLGLPAPKNAGAEPIPPKLPQPKMIRDTSTPLRPSARCSIDAMLRAGAEVVRVVERECVAGVGGRAAALAPGGEQARVRPEHAGA